MKKKSKFILLFVVGILVLLCSLSIWAMSWPTADDYYFLHDRDQESDLAVAFAVALRINHPAAYEMIDLKLTPRLDEWMKTHQTQGCARRIDDVLVFGSGGGLIVYYTCQTEDNKLYNFSVDEIIIEDMKVVDWGKIREELN